MNYQKLYNVSACLNVFSTMALGSMEIFSYLLNNRGLLMLIIGFFMLMFGMLRICTEDERLSYSTYPLGKGFVTFNIIMSMLMFLMALIYAAGLLL